MTSACARAAWVKEHVRAHCFGARASDVLTFGAELELLAFDERTHAIARIFPSASSVGSIDIARDVGRRLAWRETVSEKGVPRFVGATGGSLTFEPGGQLEYASAVHRSVDGVLRELCVVESHLRASAVERGITLLASGVDPYNGPDEAPLQLTAERYRRMAQHLASIGADGARMMRQTASLQINVGGISALDRWPIANAMAPWLVALFANSPRYAGADTGCASYRAQTWRGVDPSRTGVFGGGDPAGEYTAFVLEASAFLADESAPRFADLSSDRCNEFALATHLSTLFPEVRPRGYLELRSADALDDAGRRAALALVAGVLGDERAARDAGELLGEADDSLLGRAGRDGTRDTTIASKVDDLMEIALEGCRRLGAGIVSGETCAHLEGMPASR